MRTHQVLVAAILLGSALALAMRSQPPSEPVFTSDFGLERTPIFMPNGKTRHLSLQPGRVMHYEGLEDDGFHELEIAVLPRIRPVVFDVKGQRKLALTRIVQETEWIDGELVEVSENYYAFCPASGNIYNFGEGVRKYSGGHVVSREGSWLAGKDGAQPGLIMPQSFLLGARYNQGFAPGVSLDRAEHIEMGLTVETPAGTYTDCVKVVETTPLEPDEESISIYAPDVGLIVDDELIVVNASR